MTQQELDALKALADAATPGPWWIEGYASMFGVFANNTDEQPETICDLPDDSRYSQNNAAFIAATRAAMPALLAEVERLGDAWSVEHDAYILALLYVIRDLGNQGINPWPLYWMLLWAGTLGSNMTIAGAPALFVAKNMGEKEDQRTVGLGEFLSMSAPYVIVSLVVCYAIGMALWVIPFAK